MSRQCVTSFIVCFIALYEASIISQKKYTVEVELNYKKSNHWLLGEHNSESLTECATMCQKECIFYGFNPLLKKCRSHKMIFTSEVSNEDGWRYYSGIAIPLDCKDLRNDGNFISGVYDIYPYRTITIPVTVYCDMTTMGGGWTAIQKRVDGSVDFQRLWKDYKDGFGAPEQEYWIGNDVIHQLTKEKNSSLYAAITIHSGATLYETYNGFSVSNETEKYQLFLAGPATGTLGDGMLNTGVYKDDLSGMSFSTPDRDHDLWGDNNCASYWRGGWWFNWCHQAYLNGEWSSESAWYYPWYPEVTDGSYVKGTTMMVRRH